VGHIRKATTNSVVSLENTHPIKYKNPIFMHNGDIDVLTEKRKHWIQQIDADLRSLIRGTTDTEILFYLFLSKHRRQEKRQERRQDKPEYEQWMDSLVDTLEMIRKETPHFTANIIYANREYSLVTRYHHYSDHSPSKTESHSRSWHAPSLYWNLPLIRTIPPEGLFFAKTPKWLITSEPISVATQTLVPTQTIMCLNHQTGELYVRRMPKSTV
jgi:predicted glutamine amidotransferase